MTASCSASRQGARKSPTQLTYPELTLQLRTRGSDRRSRQEGGAQSEPLDIESGRSLDLEMPMPRTLDRRPRDSHDDCRRPNLGTTCSCGPIPRSDLERVPSQSFVHGAVGARSRTSQPRLIWAPLVDHGDQHRDSMLHVAVYAALNSAPSVRASWGLDRRDGDGQIRAQLLSAGDTTAAIEGVGAGCRHSTTSCMTQRHRARSCFHLARSLGVQARSRRRGSALKRSAQLMSTWAIELENELEIRGIIVESRR